MHHGAGDDGAGVIPAPSYLHIAGNALDGFDPGRSAGYGSITAPTGPAIL